MKIVGCDLHAKQQTIAMVDTETGEFTEKTLAHEGSGVREFYAALTVRSAPAITFSGPAQRCRVKKWRRRDCRSSLAGALRFL